MRPPAVAYVRVHGRNYRNWGRQNAESHERYDYLYTAEELRPWASRAEEIAAEPETEDAYVITNNHYRGKAAANALMVRSMIEGRSVAGPPPLVSEYGELLEGFAHPAPPAEGADMEPLEELPKRELYERARRREIAGRSTMAREELIRALRAA